MEYVDCYKYIGDEINVDIAQKMSPGNKYITYNPLTALYRIVVAGPKDIAHYKHRLSNLRYYVYQEK